MNAIAALIRFIIRLFRRTDDEFITFEELLETDLAEKPKRGGKRKNDDKAKNDDVITVDEIDEIHERIRDAWGDVQPHQVLMPQPTKPNLYTTYK